MSLSSMKMSSMSMSKVIKCQVGGRWTIQIFLLEGIKSCLIQLWIRQFSKKQLCISSPTCSTWCFCVLYLRGNGHVVGQVKQSSVHFLPHVWTLGVGTAPQEMINIFLPTYFSPRIDETLWRYHQIFFFIRDADLYIF